MDIRLKLKKYRELKASVKSIEIQIEELNDGINSVEDILQVVKYGDKIQSTNKFYSNTESSVINRMEKIEELERTKRIIERELEKIDNSLTILDDIELQVIRMLYIENKKWEPICYALDRSYSHLKRIEVQAIKKLASYLI